MERLRMSEQVLQRASTVKQELTAQGQEAAQFVNWVKRVTLGVRGLNPKEVSSVLRQRSVAVVGDDPTTGERVFGLQLPQVSAGSEREKASVRKAAESLFNRDLRNAVSAGLLSPARADEIALEKAGIIAGSIKFQGEKPLKLERIEKAEEKKVNRSGSIAPSAQYRRVKTAATVLVVGGVVMAPLTACVVPPSVNATPTHQAEVQTAQPVETKIAPTQAEAGNFSQVTFRSQEQIYQNQKAKSDIESVIAGLAANPKNDGLENYTAWGLSPAERPNLVFTLITATDQQGRKAIFVMLKDGTGSNHAYPLRGLKTADGLKLTLNQDPKDGSELDKPIVILTIPADENKDITFSPFGEDSPNQMATVARKVLANYIEATPVPPTPESSNEMTHEQIQKNFEDFLNGKLKINENINDKNNQDLFRLPQGEILPLGYFEISNLAQDTNGLVETAADAQAVLLGYDIRDNMRILYLGFENKTSKERIIVPFVTGFTKLPDGFRPKTSDEVIGDDQVILEVMKGNPPLYNPLTVQINRLYPYNSDLGKEILTAVGRPIYVQFNGSFVITSREEFIAKYQGEFQESGEQVGWFFDHSQNEQLILWLQGKGLKPAYAIVKSNLGQPITDTSKLPLTELFRIPAAAAK